MGARLISQFLLYTQTDYIKYSIFYTHVSAAWISTANMQIKTDKF